MIYIWPYSLNCANIFRFFSLALRDVTPTGPHHLSMIYEIDCFSHPIRLHHLGDSDRLEKRSTPGLVRCLTSRWRQNLIQTSRGNCRVQIWKGWESGNNLAHWGKKIQKLTSVSWKMKFSPTSVFSGPLLWTSLWTLFPDIIKLQRIYKRDDTVTRHIARERKVWKSEYVIYFWKWSPAVEWRAGWLMRREAIISGFSRRPWRGSLWVTIRRFEHKISQGVPTGPPFTPLRSALRWWQQGNTWEITEMHSDSGINFNTWRPAVTIKKTHSKTWGIVWKHLLELEDFPGNLTELLTFTKTFSFSVSGAGRNLK